ncbi:MAG: hypothetical protein AAF215_33715 [Cyanobacteria bacterium P01_A01_bin.123]
MKDLSGVKLAPTNQPFTGWQWCAVGLHSLTAKPEASPRLKRD